MIENNQTCAAGQDSIPYVTCMIHVLEEWLGVEQLEDYLNFANHLLWVFTPLILLILPYFTIFLLYLTIIFLHIYKRKNVLKEAYSHNLWDGARKTVATLWDGHAAVWHGYEVHGMEKIPEGPALIIFYHGAIPIDFYYFMAKIFIHKGRTCRVVADHFVFKIPGFSLLLDVFCALHGPREKCVEILRSGHLLAISPGGVREALLSDETYNIVWGNRKGFAQVAIDAKVPIIPMFTQNIREGFRSLGGTSKFSFIWFFDYSVIYKTFGSLNPIRKTFLISLFLFLFGDRVSLCSSGCPVPLPLPLPLPLCPSAPLPLPLECWG
ncbi:transmembrane protein 68 isoform X2 [Mastomys coucha]|uniref:transmembrane protein 68 isoform X2 n=1 Tax=Mastomys coucha TaxID=35658 RepID=UPI001261F57A|nr:transmembrane protein 68 isoform X2 [Mastomys coucha]